MNIHDELGKFCKKKGNTAFETYEKIMLFMQKHKLKWLTPYFVVHLAGIRPEILFRKIGYKSLNINQIDKSMSHFLTRLSMFGLLERQVFGKDVTFRFTGVLSEKSCIYCKKANNQQGDRCDECIKKISQERKKRKIKRIGTALLENKMLCARCHKIIPANIEYSSCKQCRLNGIDRNKKFRESKKTI
jgi:hypothetical protein